MGSSGQWPSAPISSWDYGASIAAHDRGLRLNAGAIERLRRLRLAPWGRPGVTSREGWIRFSSVSPQGYLYPHCGGE